MKPAGQRLWNGMDILFVGLLILSCGVDIHKWLRLSYTPIEDAAMLLRYSLHMAQGYGIRWNIQDAPVDGATDFLYMVLTAMVSRIGHIGVIAASRVLNIVAYLVSVLLIYAGSRTIFRSPAWLSFGAAFYLVAGPSVKMATACFGAPVFACAGLISWYFACRYMEGKRSWSTAICFSLTGLMTGLIRPEGVFFAGFLLLGLIYFCGWKQSGRAITAFAATFAILGGKYFLWRWHYFGYPLPNPFYLKGGGHIYISSLVQSAVNISIMLAPVLPLLLLGLLHPHSRRRTIAVLIPLVAFTSIWILLNNGNNHFMRFQFAMVPLVLFSLPAVLMDLGDALSLPKWASLSGMQRGVLGITYGFALIAAAAYFDRAIPMGDMGDGMRTFASRLAPYAPKGYTIVVTEAGQLPLYSDWRVIDALGLNDAWMAHHGERISTDYLDRSKPEVIMVHASDAGNEGQLRAMLLGEMPADVGGFYNFAMLSQYARQHDYTLAAAFMADACDYHLYYVRKDFPDSDAIVSLIRSHPYYFLDNGQISRDVRDDILPPGYPCFAR